MTSQDSSSTTQTFICSELEGLKALIQEGGTEVTVVTEGNAAMVTSADLPTMVCGQPDISLPAGMIEDSALACEESTLLVPNITLGGQNVVIHSMPLIVSTQPQQNVQARFQKSWDAVQIVN